MKKGCFILLFAVLHCRESLFAQKEIRLSSPDGRIVFSLAINKNLPSYSVFFNKNPLIENSTLNLQFEEGMMRKAIIGQPSAIKEVKETYKLIVGKASAVNNHYRQIIIPFSDNLNESYEVNLEVRVFNDGIAFRYLLPKKNTQSSFTLLEERTQFHFTADPITKALLLPGFTTSHEGLYATAPLSTFKEDSLIDMPVLFQFPGNIFMAITEAALLDYAGMYLVKHNGQLYSQLSPLPGQQRIKVKASFPHNSPCQVMLIRDRL